MISFEVTALAGQPVNLGDDRPDAAHCLTIRDTDATARFEFTWRIALTTDELSELATGIAERLRNQQPLVERMDPI